MSIEIPPICFYCKHLVRNAPWAELPKCAAFPDGIPAEIYFEHGDHRQSRDGDHGIQFALEVGMELPAVFP